MLWVAGLTILGPMPVLRGLVSCVSALLAHPVHPVPSEAWFGLVMESLTSCPDPMRMLQLSSSLLHSEWLEL